LLLNGNLEVLSRKLNVTLGADHNDMDYTRRNEFVQLGTANIYAGNFDDVPVAAVPPSLYTQDTEFRSHGVFGQVQFRPFDRLGILLGGHYDWTEQSNASLSGGEADESNSKFDAFTGRAGITFDVSEQITLYAQYSEIFTPNTFDVGSRGGGVLPPVTGEIYEAGVKTEWLDGKLGVNASLFRILRDNVPIPDPGNGPGESFSVASGLQRADGFELEVNGEPLPGWNVSFAGTLLDSEFIDHDDPNFGNRPTDAARWQLGLYTSYELQSGPWQGAGLGAGLFAVDERPVTASSSGTIDGYTRVDLQAFYRGLEPLDFSVQVRNVFDETYVESLERPGGLNHFGAPRSFLVSARLRL
jgi:iron complex outermembrane recepter protein